MLTQIGKLETVIFASTIPISISLLFILGYYIHYKKLLRLQMKEVPSLRYRGVDLEKIHRSLEIKIMVCNFILVLLGLESMRHLLYICGFSYRFIMKVLRHIPISQELTTILYTTRQTMLTVSVGIQLMIVPTVYLLLKVLPLAYYNYPYKHIVKRWAIFIPLRSVIFLVVEYIPVVGAVFPEYMRAGVYLTDWIMYWFYARRFYLVLKGRRLEARWHSTLEDYREKTQVQFQYLVTSITFGIIASTLVLKSMSVALYDMILLLLEESWTLEKSWAVMKLDSSTYLGTKGVSVMHQVWEYLFNVGFYGSSIAHQIINDLVYLTVLLMVIVKLVQRWRKFRNINKLVAPLMSHYHKTLEDRYQNYA